MTHFGLLAVLVAFAPAFSAAGDQVSVLGELGTNLRQARSLPADTKTTFQCPEGLHTLVGTSMATVLKFLSNADDVSGNAHSYFLTSPATRGWRGGGFPEVTFYFTKAGTIERVTCLYAR